MRTSAVLACLTLLTLAAPAVAASSMDMANGYGWIGTQRDIDPERLGSLFCKARIAGDMAPLEPYFAPKLADLLSDLPAGAAVPWQGLPDRPQSCAVSILNGFDNTVGVLVRVAYVAGPHQWADTLNLERTPDSWRLNNVFYEAGGNLRFRLVALEP